MENNKISAKDFFLHLGSMVALYAVSISFLNLIFRIINKAFPEVNYNIYAWGGGSEMSLPVATLIVVFPIFIIISRFVHKIYEVNPEKKDIWIRRWLTYVTLFVAGIVLTVDLVMVLYKFLDGQDLTVAFLLKALAVLAVASCVFGFYLQDIRDKVSAKSRKIWAGAIAIIILASIILGFGVLGSPKTQRLLKQDNQKIIDLQNIQWQVINYWQVNGRIPEKWEDMMIDVQTGSSYLYKKTGELNFELCAAFNRSSLDNSSYAAREIFIKPGLRQNENWSHPAGDYCFGRSIDPIAYPTQVRG